MEYLEGDTLAQRIKKGALPLDQVLKCAIEVADEAHRHGVVHRDLKPGNIMLTSIGAKLLDFGVAKIRRNAGDSGIAQEATSALDGDVSTASYKLVRFLATARLWT